MMQQWNRAAAARAWNSALTTQRTTLTAIAAPTAPSALAFNLRALHTGATALRFRHVHENEEIERKPSRHNADASAARPPPRATAAAGGKGRHEHSQRKQRRAKKFTQQPWERQVEAAPETSAAADQSAEPSSSASRVHPPRTARPVPEPRRSDLRHPSSAFFKPAQKEWYQQQQQSSPHQQQYDRQPQQRELSLKEEQELMLTEADEAEFAEGAEEEDEHDDDAEDDEAQLEDDADEETPVASAPSAASDSAPSQQLSFRELGVASHVHTKLPGAFDVHAPTGIQCAAIPFLIRSAPQQFRDRDDGSAAKRGTPQGLNAEDAAHQALREKLRRTAGLPRDLVIQDMTGSGKTLSYVLPLLTLVDNFKSGHLQGVVIAPTRELAVQIYRVMRRLNDTRNAGARRKKHPVTIRLAIGHVTEAYAEDVRHNPAHIIIATPDTFAALALGIAAKPDPRSRFRPSRDQAQKFEVRPSVNLRHVRMLVCDEVDHLLLPATAPTIERILQSLTNTASHGSMHRLGRVVLVSAALSPRVEFVAAKWLNRVVTATSEGLLDGWLPPNRMLKDRFLIKKNKSGEAATKEAENADVANEDAEPETTLPRPRNLSHLSPAARAAYEEADDFVSEADEEAEDHASLLELKAQDEALLRARKRERDLAAGVPVNLLDEAVAQAAAAASHVVKAEDFVLPGLRRPVAADDAEEGKTEEAVALPLHAAFPLPAGGEHSHTTAVAAAGAGSASSLTSPLTAGVAPSAGTPAPPADESPLPSASTGAVRFLPSSMRHLALHVGPKSKPLLHAGSTDEERAQAMAARVDLLAQVHAALRPRVAIVFFTRAVDALACAADLRARKRLRVEVLLSGGGLRAADRLRAIESVLHGSVDLVLATDMAARGLDLRGLSHVVNFDLPPTALDYVHRAGRVERLGGARGCTVVNIVRDLREGGEGAAAAVAPPVDPANPTFPLPKRKGTFSGAQVPLLRRLAGQLHLDMAALTLREGKLVPLQVQQRGTHIKTPPTPPKKRNGTADSTTTETNASDAAAAAPAPAGAASPAAAAAQS